MAAAKNSGIRPSKKCTLVLDEKNANSFTELNGEELYVGDTVEILESAWYQKGLLVEQGLCKLLNGGEDESRGDI